MKRLAKARVFMATIVGLGLLACSKADEPTWGLVADTDPSEPTAAPRGAPVTQLDPASSNFATIAAVLQSPRCRNCHPAGDAPLQTDAGSPHAMNITRLSASSGLECGTCHQGTNIANGPPGAPHWALPPGDTPMVFEGLSADALCQQLRDPGQNGGRSLDDLLEHVRDDPLVRWGWAPGAGRSVPPLSHARFVAVFGDWVHNSGPCPSDAPTDISD